MAFGIIWFSLASLLLPAAFSPAVSHCGPLRPSQSAHLSLPACQPPAQTRPGLIGQGWGPGQLVYRCNISWLFLCDTASLYVCSTANDFCVQPDFKKHLNGCGLAGGGGGAHPSGSRGSTCNGGAGGRGGAAQHEQPGRDPHRQRTPFHCTRRLFLWVSLRYPPPPPPPRTPTYVAAGHHDRRNTDRAFRARTSRRRRCHPQPDRAPTSLVSGKLLRRIQGPTHCSHPIAGNLLGLVLSPLLLSAFGWRTLFLVFGVFGGPLLLLWQLMVPDAPPSPMADAAVSPPPSPPPEQRQRGTAGDEQRSTQQVLLRSSPTATELAAVADLTGAGSSPSTTDGRVGGAAFGAAASVSGRADSGGGAGEFAADVPLVSAASGAAAAAEVSAPPPQQSVGVRRLLGSSAVWAIVVVNVVNHWCGPVFVTSTDAVLE